MPAHMLPKPRKGTARKMQQARRRLAQATLAAASVLVRERDGHCCRWCGDRYGVEVHHIVYRSRGGTHDTSNLVCLCGRCHRAVHAKKLHIDGDADVMLEIAVVYGSRRRAVHSKTRPAVA